jgi:uncharacterized membrane protein
VSAASGLALLIGFRAGDFPHPVGRVVVLAVGAALVVFGVILWRAPIDLRTLAAGNLVTAAAVVWLAAAGHFSASGAALVGGAAAALVVLAAWEAATLRR